MKLLALTYQNKRIIVEAYKKAMTKVNQKRSQKVLLIVSNFKGPLTTNNDDKLKFYSLFKQATVGDVNTERPGFFSIVEKMKWYVLNCLHKTFFISRTISVKKSLATAPRFF